MEKISGQDEKYQRAVEKFKKYGPLSATSEDHAAIGSTPPKILLENPGKNKAELMSDSEILFWLDENIGQYKNFFSATESSPFIESYLPSLRSELNATLEYLKTIDRLPDEYKEYDIDRYRGNK
jgi:hypothetical protein